MANLYERAYPDGSYTNNFSITDEYTVNEDREYLINPLFKGSKLYWSKYGGTTYGTGVMVANITGFTEYSAICERQDHLFYDSNDIPSNCTVWDYLSGEPRPNQRGSCTMPTSTMGWAIGSDITETASMNIPIFTYENRGYYQQYISTQLPLETRNEALKHALNYNSGATLPETKEYFYYGRANEITVNEVGEISNTGSPQLTRGFRVKSTGRVSLYATEGIDNGHLKLMINMSDVEIAYYSYDLETWQNQQGSPTTLPFNFVWRGWDNEIGTFYCSGTRSNPLYETNCPVFLNKQDSDDYNETGEGGENAINWNEISNNAPIFNPTGLDDDATVFGEVYAQAMFTQQYICSTGALREIANAFFDTTQGGITGIFEDIKKGLEMYGEGSGVVDAVQGCTFYPFDLNQVFTQVQSQNYIYFGGYKFNMQNSVNKIIYPNGYIDFGTFTIERTFNSYRDYAPYQRLYVYLPYLAWYELDLNKYLGKSVNVRYYIDTRSGGLCMAVLSVNSVMTDYMVGQIGVAYPMTLTDYSRFASAQLQTLLGGGKGVLSQGGNVAQTTQNMAELGASASEIAVGGLALGSVGVAFQGAKTLYGLTQNNINNFNKTIGSGATSMLNEYLPQEVCFMFEVQEADETPNERMLQGYPSNSSGTIGSFSGYLEVDTVNLVCADATANEKAQIVSMLKSGVYI